MRGHGTKFTRKMEAAVAALLTQRNQEEAARSVGIGPATLLRWQKLPEFQDAYRQARRQAVSQSVARLQQASSAAVSTLLKVMVDASTEWSKKLSETHNARADVKGIAGWLISVGSTMGRRYNFEPEQKVQNHTEDP